MDSHSHFSSQLEVGVEYKFRLIAGYLCELTTNIATLIASHRLFPEMNQVDAMLHRPTGNLDKG